MFRLFRLGSSHTSLTLGGRLSIGHLSVKLHNELELPSRLLHLGCCSLKPVHVKMPSLSPTMTEGSIAQWTKKEGDEVSAGDVLCEVQTDKAVVALECDEDGVLAKIVVPEKSSTVSIGELIAVIASPDEDWKAVAASAPSTITGKITDSVAAAETAPSEPSKKKLDATVAQPTMGTPDNLGPAVRLLVQSYSLDVSKIPASGPRGQLLKGDVLSYLASQPQVKTKSPASSPPPLSPPSPVASAATTVPASVASTKSAEHAFTDIPLTNMRQTIAKRLTESKSTIPHAYVRTVVDMENVLELRARLKDHIGLKLSVNDLVIKACALALRLVPQLNSLSDPARKVLVPQPSVDICMAVATPAGLITPILRDADHLPITQLSTLASALAVRARDGKLQPREFQGGSFTISNLGMFGIREFTAVINPPQVAILAVGCSVLKPIETDAGRIRFASKMALTMSVDSRYVDEVLAGRFLSHVSRLLGDHPNILLAGDPRVTSDLNDNALYRPDNFDLMMVSACLPVFATSS